MKELNKDIFIYTENEIDLIKKIFFKHIFNLVRIKHFAITLVTPEDRYYLISSSKDFTTQFKNQNYHRYDNTLCPMMYENLDFYSWSNGFCNEKQKEIKNLKTSYHLYNGTVFVRKLEGNFKLLYSVATSVPDPIMKTLFVNKANEILRAGDLAFDSFYSFFEEKSNCKLPRLERFQPFLYEEIPDLYEHEKMQRKHIDSLKSKCAGIINGERPYLRLIVNNEVG